MAQLAPLNATPMRQAFGLLDNTKLRSLQSVKNRQNALTNSAPSLKRRYASPENSDTENVDPNLHLSTKRKRSALDDDVASSKSARQSLNTITESKCLFTHFTPRLDVPHKAPSPASAPAAAGRSPTQSKRPGLLNSKRPKFAPPSFGAKSPSLSMAAALNGTLAQKKPRRVRTLEESKPKSWFFDIYEESQEQQDYRMNEWCMTQSAIILDISDDESKANEANDRGKENVDPNEISIPVTRSAAKAAALVSTSARTPQKDSSMEPRSPLSDLNPAEYYAEGLDATSVALVPDEEEAATAPTHTAAVNNLSPSDVAHDLTFAAATVANPPEPETMTTAELNALLAAAAPAFDFASDLVPSPAEPAEIEIWESESAKDENEAHAELHLQQYGEGDVGSDPIFALQEI